MRSPDLLVNLFVGQQGSELQSNVIASGPNHSSSNVDRAAAKSQVGMRQRDHASFDTAAAGSQIYELRTEPLRAQFDNYGQGRRESAHCTSI